MNEIAVPPVETRHLFPIIDAELISLLRSLDAKDWNNQTLAPLWSVKDIAAHLLDGNLRGISIYRDGHLLKPNQDISDYGDLIHYINELNASWTYAAHRISNELLTDLLALTGKMYSEQIATLSPFEEAVFGVAWAGETKSLNWFHVAREYTEKFHHQLQIREAVGRPGLITPELFHPFISALMLGLPHAYRATEVPESTVIEVAITGTVGGIWSLLRQQSTWTLMDSKITSSPDTTIAMPAEVAWKLFTKGMTKDEAKRFLKITGNPELANAALSLVAIIG